ncbi:MAG: CoA transferase subunit A [Clostridiales bacterium]|nr:CoA transferase subunit A [Clostridiales bacterium]
MKKLCSLFEAMEQVRDGMCVGLGGNTLNRAPMAAVFAMICQGRRHMRVVKTAGGMDVDALCLAGCADAVDAGFISYESQYGLAQHYRRSVQNGLVKANEHACYTVISALRAASYGIPFMPVRGLKRSDLRRVNGYFKDVTDPFSGETLAAVQAIRPDVAVVHAQIADGQGNALFEGPKYEDVLLSRAAKSVIVTAERIVGEDWFAASPEKADIPHFLVSAVVHAPHGAAPCACYGYYEPDEAAIRAFLALEDARAFDGFLEKECRL